MKQLEISRRNWPDFWLYNGRCYDIYNKKCFVFPRFITEFSVELSLLNENIWNFGYSVRYKEKSLQDGRETKEIFTKHEREQIRIMIHEVTSALLEEAKPEIVVRGPMTEVKKSLPRYKETTSVFLNNDYTRFEEYVGDYGYWWIHRKNIEIPSWNFLKEPPPPGYS